MKNEKIPYDRQIFVCVNNKNGEKPSCGDHQGEEVFKELRQIAKDKGLHPRIRVAQAKCLGQCSTGVNMMIYPDNVWLSGVRKEDVAGIAEKYLKAPLA